MFNIFIRYTSKPCDKDVSWMFCTSRVKCMSICYVDLESLILIPQYCALSYYMLNYSWEIPKCSVFKWSKPIRLRNSLNVIWIPNNFIWYPVDFKIFLFMWLTINQKLSLFCIQMNQYPDLNCIGLGRSAKSRVLICILLLCQNISL